MTGKKMVWVLAAGLWMTTAATGISMGAEPADTPIKATRKADESGWVRDGGIEKYKDSKGNYVTNDWKTKDGKSYYLNSEGEVAKSTWIANTYYVNSTGAMVKNSWVHEDGADGLKEQGWYYLGRDGKAEEDGWKNIGDGRYSFDNDGRMRTGWYYDGDHIYYLGENGAMSRGWLCLEFDEDKLPAEGEISREYESAGENAKWFYFQSNGKAKRAVNGEYEDASIDGGKYYFDENGVMLTGWHGIKSSPDSGDAVGISRFVYLGDQNDGAMVKGQWKELSVHPGGSADKDAIREPDGAKGPREGDKEWYYFENNGTPAYLKAAAKTMNGVITKVNGEGYFLDQYGCRQKGMVKVTSGSVVLTGYFGDKNSDGRMRTGRVDGIEDALGESHTFYFASSGSGRGAGVSGEKDGFLYYNGLLIAAQKGTDYQAYEVDGRVYLVNTAGRVQTNEKVYKVDGVNKYVLESGILYNTDSSGNKGAKASGKKARLDFDFDKEYRL